MSQEENKQPQLKENQNKESKEWLKELPDKKRYLELVSAALSIPLLITVILNNVTNLNDKKPEINTSTPAPETTPIVIQNKDTKEEISIVKSIPTSVPKEINNPEKENINPTPNPECKKDIGPIEILYPKENELIEKKSVCIDISYSDPSFCSVVWSYRLDNDDWSDFSDKNFCIYNLSSGEKNLELKVKSLSSKKEIVLKRNFLIKSDTVQTNPTPAPTIQAAESTSSANSN